MTPTVRRRRRDADADGATPTARSGYGARSKSLWWSTERAATDRPVEGRRAAWKPRAEHRARTDEPARQRTKGPSRARNLGRAADGNPRGAFVGEPGTRSSWPTGKERCCGQCRRVLNTPHQAGSKHEGWSVCAQIFPKPCEPAGGNVRGLPLSR